MLLFQAARWLRNWLQKDFEETPAEHGRSVPEVEWSEAVDSQAENGESAEDDRAVVQRPAMGCVFEIALRGRGEERLLAAGEEALDEIGRLDRQLSHYRHDSDVARLREHWHESWVRLEPAMYGLLDRCRVIHQGTEGAFDITTGPLVKAWGFFDGVGRVPSSHEIESALAATGLGNVAFDPEDHLVHATVPGMELDLGAVGKGYALDEAAERLRLYGIRNCVLHGGKSTLLALGSDSDGSPWTFPLRDPRDQDRIVERFELRDEALSVSGIEEQSFVAGGVRYGHLLDPRTGWPVRERRLVAVVAPSAELSDALSTAFYVLGPEKAREIVDRWPGVRVIMLEMGAEASKEPFRFGVLPPNTGGE